MEALILVGHGSLRAGSGAAMIRMAARLRERGAADLVGAGFLNYSRPSFGATLERLVGQGAHSALVQPYFLLPGAFVRSALPRMLAGAQVAHPQLPMRLAEPFGAHPALAELVVKRAAEAGASPRSVLLLVAHGSPDPAANDCVREVAALLRARRSYAAVALSYLSLNAPTIGEAIAALAAAGQRQVVVLPYMLQLGGHVSEDLPALVAAAAAAHPQVQMRVAAYLGYDPLIAEVISDRVTALRASCAISFDGHSSHAAVLAG
jgi:sirohydrochlorin ferrochelatase